MKRMITLLAALPCLLTIGCKPPAPATPTAPTAGAPTSGTTADTADDEGGHHHDHGDSGPHGGHLLHLEPSGAHAEWTHDDDENLITVYLDDFDADEITAVKFTVTIGEEAAEEFELTQADEGWTITSQELLTHINMGEAAKVALVVEEGDTPQSAAIEAHEHHHH